MEGFEEIGGTVPCVDCVVTVKSRREENKKETVNERHGIWG